jgi:hypothetical protein
MSNTWDTVFEEGFSSVPVCNNCTIICSLVLQALTCHFVCYVPVFCYFKYCCIPLVVYLCDVPTQLVNFLYFVKLSFCLFGFVSFFFSSKLLQAFLIKGILRPSHVCFICGTLPTGTPTVCIPNLFSAKRKSQRRAPPIR